MESMPTESCSASSCTMPGTLLCTGCVTPPSRYCSKDCQRRDWVTHKLHCASAQKSNCFLIRASASSSSSGTNEPTFADYIEPFNLQGYGNEAAETAELNSRLGWAGAVEAGKFYDHKGSDTWYYYAYKPRVSRKTSLPVNKVGSLCTGQEIHGDLVVVRSGPVDSTYVTSFSKAELVRTAQFYMTADPMAVFGEREKSRAMRKFGFPPEMADQVPSLHINM